MSEHHGDLTSTAPVAQQPVASNTEQLASLDKDASPVQPRDGEELGPSQQMTELKEGEVFSADSNVASNETVPAISEPGGSPSSTAQKPNATSTNTDGYTESHEQPTTDPQKSTAFSQSHSSSDTDALPLQSRDEEESGPSQQMAEFQEAVIIEEEVSNSGSNVASAETVPEIGELVGAPPSAADAAQTPNATSTDTDGYKESHEQSTTDPQKTTEFSQSHSSLDTDALPLQPRSEEESGPSQQMTELKEAVVVCLVVCVCSALESVWVLCVFAACILMSYILEEEVSNSVSNVASAETVSEIGELVGAPPSAADAAQTPNATSTDTDGYKESHEQSTTDPQKTTEFSQSHSSLDTDALPLQPRSEEESGPSQQMIKLKEADVIEEEVSISNSNVASAETVPELSVPRDDPTCAASAALTPSAAYAHRESQQQSTLDAQDKTDISTTQASFDPVSFPLQSSVDEESDPSQHMTELKEVAIIEEEVYSAGPNRVSEETVPGESDVTFEHGSCVGRRNTGVNSSEADLTSPMFTPTSGELHGEGYNISPAANQQVPQENYLTTQASMMQASNRSDTIATLPQQPSHIHEESANSPVQQSLLRLPMPGPNWEFDDLLVDLTNMITSSDELNTLKFKFYSDFHKQTIDNITSPSDLFIQMKQRQLISANNIIYLQAILMKLKRPELIERTIDYCVLADKILAFDPATGTPENGYKYVTVHLYLDKAYGKDDITLLQLWVAKILCCPSSFVHLPAIEPSNSLLVTIMLPEMYVDILVKYLDQNLLHDKFAALGIDTITTDGKEYQLKDSDDNQASSLIILTKRTRSFHQNGDCEQPGTTRSDEQLVSLYHQLSNKDLQLKGLEHSCYQLRQKIEELEIQGRDKTTQSEESDTERKQLMEKVEMLENIVESKVVLLEESEIRCKQLERKMRDLEKQRGYRNARSQEKQNECRQLEDRIENLEQRDNTLGKKLDEVEKENRALIESNRVLRQEIESLNEKIIENEDDQQWLNKNLVDIYYWNADYITSVSKQIEELESEPNEGGETELANTGKTAKAIDQFAYLAVLWIQRVRVLHAEFIGFIADHGIKGDSGQVASSIQRETRSMPL